MLPYTELEAGMAPDWSHSPRARFEWEMQDLQHFVGDDVRFDDDLLRMGKLRLEFRWPMPDGKALELEATFPDSYPFIRPMVRLLGSQATYPDRHVSPTDGTLCLLGRDSGLWSAKWTLATLLEKQLANALSGAGIEDPQAEPIEVWWNNVAQSPNWWVEGSYMLVDSVWSLVGADCGTLDVLFKVQRRDEKLLFQAAVSEVRDKSGTVLATAAFALPRELARGSRSAQFPWRRAKKLLPPARGDNDSVWDEVFFNRVPVDTDGPSVALSFTVQSGEIAHGQQGETWVCALFHGPKKRFRTPKPGRTGQALKPAILPIYRAGAEDLGGRVPSVATLRNHTIAVVGIGAIGAPIVMELARNGCRKIIILDHDIVEPGNSIRWPLGSSSWGRRKTESLKLHVEAEYPHTEVQAIVHVIGALNNLSGDNNILPRVIEEATLVIDASASTGVSRFLAHLCQRAGKKMLSVYGTASLKGGVVACYHPMSGCPTCKEYAYDQGLIGKPPGSGETDAFRQLPGCAELTFTGASLILRSYH